VKDCKKDLKVKAKGPLTEFLAIVKDTLAELRKDSGTDSLRYQLMHMRDILERWKVRVSASFFLATLVMNMQISHVRLHIFFLSLPDCWAESKNPNQT
jgi:hypothetical protein